MFTEYMTAALEKAQYKIIDDEYPYFAEVPELEGVWATGKTIEECRNELIEINRRVDRSLTAKGIIHSNALWPNHWGSLQRDDGRCLN